MEMTERPEYRWEKVVDGIFALAIWDESWSSYNNCYLVAEDAGLILVDTGKSDHAGFLTTALAEMGHTSDEVQTILSTHGHRDHIGGSALFPGATKHIHSADFELLPQALREQFLPDLPSQGLVGNFECVLLGQHTSGSVALFHRPTDVLFCGDHICLFGHPLPAGRLVGQAPDARKNFRRFVAGWRSDWPPSEGARRKMEVDLAQRRPEDQQRYDFDLFRRGLSVLREFDAAALCTGHGPVLVGGIREYVDDLSQI